MQKECMYAVMKGDERLKQYVFEETKKYSKDKKELEYSISELKQLLLRPYYKQVICEKSILFWMPSYAYFVDSILSLIYRYIKERKRCIVMIPVEDVIEIGDKNINDMIVLIKQIEFLGGRCYSNHQKNVYSDKFSLCYLCSEYSYPIPSTLRRNIDYVVALQTTALYVHMYRIKERFNDVFSEKQRKEIDYLITSNYMADWIGERDTQWNEKILRFGYPKLDALYNAFSSEISIPKEWKKKIEGKKVLLVTNVEEMVLNILGKEESCAIIWRPHPLVLQEKKDWVKCICKKYQNIILDDMVSYYISFRISDALISGIISSIMVNYLYTGKALCFYDTKFDQNPVIDFRKEVWYKSAYIVSTETEVLEFARMIAQGKDMEKQELAYYRHYIINNFDGKVCDRVYDFFEDKMCN